jgi:hypothetical protein
MPKKSSDVIVSGEQATFLMYFFINTSRRLLTFRIREQSRKQSNLAVVVIVVAEPFDSKNVVPYGVPKPCCVDSLVVDAGRH